MKSEMKILALILVIVVGFLWMATWLTSSMGLTEPSGSVVNKNPRGISVFYETLKSLDIDVDRKVMMPEDVPTDTVQILAVGTFYDFEGDEALLDWAESGGHVIYITPLNIESGQDFGEDVLEVYPNIWNQSWGDGEIYYVSGIDINNKALIKSTETAYDLAKVIENTDKKVLFNEYILFPEGEHLSFWDLTPVWVKLVIYQLMILAGAWFWLNGRGLGKQQRLLEETERTELEYLKSAAQFYKRANCWSLMTQFYFKSLLRLLRTNQKEWLIAWGNEVKENIKQAEELDKKLQKVEENLSMKEALDIIGVIEHLKNILIIRRQSPWSKYLK